MTWYVDASVLIALGRQSELDLLTALEGVVVLPAVREEVTQEPEATNVDRFVASLGGIGDSPSDDAIDRAMEVLDEDGTNGDVALVATVLAGHGESTGIVSDDRRIRTVADGLGVTVTGTIGVVVNAVEEDLLTSGAGKQLLRDLDRTGFHVTGALLDRADDLIDEAARE